jgi:hypothetical protein
MLAIDGRCGNGNTTLAQFLGRGSLVAGWCIPMITILPIAETLRKLAAEDKCEYGFQPAANESPEDDLSAGKTGTITAYRCSGRGLSCTSKPIAARPDNNSEGAIRHAFGAENEIKEPM